MTKVIYTYIAPNGTKKDVASFPQVQALVDAKGGHYKVEYKKVPHKSPTLSLARKAYLKARFV